MTTLRSSESTGVTDSTADPSCKQLLPGEEGNASVPVLVNHIHEFTTVAAVPRSRLM